jgi:hypothetical protein
MSGAYRFTRILRKVEEHGAIGVFWDPLVQQFLVKPRVFDRQSIQPMFYFTDDLSEAQAVARHWREQIEEAEAAMAQERIEGPTPRGGAYSIAYYQNTLGNAVPKEQACFVEIVEYSKDGEHIARTYGEIEK